MVNIFIVSIKDFNETLINTISSEQLMNARKYKIEDDFKRSVLSSCLKNYVFNKLKVLNKEIVIGEFNKPYLKSNELSFNISHSGEYVVCATSNYEIGIDVEKIREVNQLVVNKCFFEDEKKFVITNDDFTKIWTLKESYIKMLGTGLKTKLNSFSVLNKINDYNFVSFKINDYYLSVCYKQTEKVKINYLNI